MVSAAHNGHGEANGFSVFVKTKNASVLLIINEKTKENTTKSQRREINVHRARAGNPQRYCWSFSTALWSKEDFI